MDRRPTPLPVTIATSLLFAFIFTAAVSSSLAPCW